MGLYLTDEGEEELERIKKETKEQGIDVRKNEGFKLCLQVTKRAIAILFENSGVVNDCCCRYEERINAFLKELGGE